MNDCCRLCFGRCCRMMCQPSPPAASVLCSTWALCWCSKRQVLLTDPPSGTPFLYIMCEQHAVVAVTKHCSVRSQQQATATQRVRERAVQMCVAVPVAFRLQPAQWSMCLQCPMPALSDCVVHSFLGLHASPLCRTGAMMYNPWAPDAFRLTLFKCGQCVG